MKRIYMITGPAHAGKTTAAEMLKELTGHLIVIRKQAGVIKEMLRALDLTEKQLNGSLREEACDELCGATPRHAMQTLGTEWGRTLIHADIWARISANRTDSLLKATEPRGVAFDDVRFLNEIEVMQEAFPEEGQVVVINIVPEFPEFEGIPATHESEQHELPWDYQIHNKGDKDEFRAQMREVLVSTGWTDV